MNIHYSILIQWSEDDQAYVASLPEFGPFVHTHGATYEESLQNAREVLNLLVEDTSPLPCPRTFRMAEEARAF